MNDGSRIAHPIEILFGSGVALACGLDAQVLAGQLHGLFAGDTRVLSTYRIGINGHPWTFLSRTRPSAATAAWVFRSPRLRTLRADIEESEILLTLHREVNGYLHDELRLRTFLEAEAQVRFSFQLDADFADIFQVKDQTLPPHLAVARFRTEDGLQLRYVRSRFSRGLRLHFHPSSGNLVHSGGLILFDLQVKPGEDWVCSLDAIPEVNGEATTSWAKSANSRSGSERERPHIAAPRLVESVWKQSSSDLDALAIPQQDGDRLTSPLAHLGFSRCLAETRW